MTVAAALVVLVFPVRPEIGACRTAREAAREAGGRDAVAWLEPGPLRGWQRLGAGWLLRFQPDHGAWLHSVWMPDLGGSERFRLAVGDWLPGARLSPELAASWLGDAPGLSRELLARRDWSTDARGLAGSVPTGGGLPRSTTAPGVTFTAVLAGLLMAGAVVRRLEPEPGDRLWPWLVAVAGGGLIVLGFANAPLAGRLFAAEVRPLITTAAWWAGTVVLMGGVLFAAVTCPVTRGGRRQQDLPWAFLVGVAAAGVSPSVWVIEVASLSTALPTLAAVVVLAGWLIGLAGDGLDALVRTFGRARVPLLAGCAVAVVMAGGPLVGPALAVIAAAAGGREGGAWLGLAAIGGVVTGSLAAVCLWPAAQWTALALFLGGFGMTLLAALRCALHAQRPAADPR